MPKEFFDQIKNKPSLNHCPVTLVSYGNFKFRPIGEVHLKCSFKDKVLYINFVIVDFASEPLLGLNDCLRFSLIKKINNLNSELKTKDDVYKHFSDVFEGLGEIPGHFNIELEKNATPVVQCPRKVPLALHGPLKKTLDNLESKNIIEKVTYPTEWVNSLMITEKPDKSLRICIDPKPLNKFIKREHFMIPTSTDIISKLAGKTIFTVIDMKDGFWQCVLNKQSSDLCVFNSPFGRYKFNRLPFGISSSPELFQRKSFEIFGQIKNVHIYFDDLILATDSEIEHDITLSEVFKKAKENNVKFNFKKLQLKLPEVKFMGYKISKNGVRPDSENIEAIKAIDSPTNKSEVLRVLGLAKFFSKFIPNLSALTTNLRNLTRQDIKFEWTTEHEDELNRLKYLITHSPALNIFNPKLDITIQCDASSEGLGCVLLQDSHPVSFSSRTLTKSEKRYAQIEKELLAICFAFEKFHYYVYGHPVIVHTDHKPLVPIFGKNLDKISNRLQRMMLKLLKYDIKIVYIRGRDMLVADILSRSFIKNEVPEDPEMQYIIHSLSNNIAMSDEKKDLFKKRIESDTILKQVKYFCENQNKWPENDKNLNSDLKFYFRLRDNIYLSNDLLFLNSKIIVPDSLRKDMLNLVHQTHFGITKTKSRARQLFYWPKMCHDIENLISNCEKCETYQKSNQKETMISHPIPNRPWQFLFSDFFEFKGKIFILLVDAYSNWVEVSQTKGKTAFDVIQFCKDKFSQFGIPDVLYADNMPYNSNALKLFAKDWNFELKFSSPHHHQSNGLAERYVGIIKDMLKKSNSLDDLPLLLMEHRNTPLTNMPYSPSQLLLNKLIKTKIPISVENLKPLILDSNIIQNKLENKQLTQKRFYDRNAKDLPKLNKGDNIQKGTTWDRGKVEDIVNDRSYIVKDSYGTILRRNRRYLKETNLPYIDNSLLYDVNLGVPSSTDLDVSSAENDVSVDNHDNSFPILLDNNVQNTDNDLTNVNDVDFNNTANTEVHDDLLSNFNFSESDDNETIDQTGDVEVPNQKNKRTRKLPFYLKDFKVAFDSDTSVESDYDSC